MLRNKPLPNNITLKCDNLKICLGKKKHKTTLIENFSYSFEKGKIYGIIGNSGVGKTTLVSHFNGLVKSRYGNIYIKDLSILGKHRRIRKYKKIRKEIVLSFQEPHLQLFKDTVLKDVAFGPRNFGLKKDKAYACARTYLDKISIVQELYEQSPLNLSNGQQRRVCLVGVLAIEPSIYIFDEPTAGLDPAGIRLLKNIIIKLKQAKKTIILVSHDVDLILELCDESILLHEKNILLHGHPYDIFTSSLLTRTHIQKPNVIRFIDALVSCKPFYKSLYDKQPRTIDQLFNDFKALRGSRGRK